MKKILQFAGLMALSLAASAQTIYVENFETGNAEKIGGSNVTPHVAFSTSACGEAQLTDKDTTDFFPEAFKPYIVTPRTSTGSSMMIDISSNTKLILGVRGKVGTTFRAAFVSSKTSGDTPRLRDETKLTLTKKDYELEELVFDFTNTVDRNSFDASMTEAIWLEVNPTGGVVGIPGGVFFIDYVVVGDKDATVNETTCTGKDPVFGDGSTYSVIDFATEGQPGISGDRVNQIILDHIPACGVTKIADRTDTTLLDNGQPLFVSSRDESGEPIDVDMTGNTKVVVRALAFGSDAEIRVDLKASDATGGNSTNGGEARITRTFPAGEWVEREYTFLPAQLKDLLGGDVEVTAIKGINLSFNQKISENGGGIGADSIVFDYISFGEPTGVENTLCVNGLGSKQIVSTLKFFPNPVSDVLSLESPVNGTLNIMNQLGEVVKTEEISSNTSSVSTSSLESGMYIIQVSTVEGKVFTNTFSKD